MSYQNFAEAYIQPQYTSLKPVNKDTSTNYSQELMIFLSQHPEFSAKQSHLEFLRYCYEHYINCDPVSRNLPIQEKLKKAGEMSKFHGHHYWGKRITIGLNIEWWKFMPQSATRKGMDCSDW